MVDNDGRWRTVADGCWVRTMRDGGPNVGLVAGTDACLLVDAGSSPEEGRALAASIAEVTDVPLRHVVVTHHHDESWYGLAGLGDVEVHAHADVASHVDDPEAAVAGVTPVVPQHLFHLADVIDLGGRVVEALHCGTGHSSTDVWVNVADAHVVYAGDLVTQGEDPFPTAESDLANWAKTLDVIVSSTRPDALIVPGDGEPMTQEELERMAADMHSVIGQTKMLIQGGMRREEAEAIGGWPWTARLGTLLDAAWRGHEKAGVRQQFPLTPRPSGPTVG